jgi:hypothetical protein
MGRGHFHRAGQLEAVKVELEDLRRVVFLDGDGARQDPRPRGLHLDRDLEVFRRLDRIAACVDQAQLELRVLAGDVARGFRLELDSDDAGDLSDRLGPSRGRPGRRPEMRGQPGEQTGEDEREGDERGGSRGHSSTHARDWWHHDGTPGAGLTPR